MPPTAGVVQALLPSQWSPCFLVDDRTQVVKSGSHNRDRNAPLVSYPAPADPPPPRAPAVLGSSRWCPEELAAGGCTRYRAQGSLPRPERVSCTVTVSALSEPPPAAGCPGLLVCRSCQGGLGGRRLLLRRRRRRPRPRPSFGCLAIFKSFLGEEKAGLVFPLIACHFSFLCTGVQLEALGVDLGHRDDPIALSRAPPPASRAEMRPRLLPLV